MNLLLIGFMGVGKGTIAREVAKKKIFVIDTDDLIESFTGKKIRKIFEEEGEESFRKLEQKTANWLECCVKNTLISCGGGFYKVKNLKSIGKVIYLKADFEWIYNRITASKNAQKKIEKRPLFKSYEKAKELFEARIEEYKRAADFVVDATLPKEQCAERIAEIYRITVF